MRVEFSSGPVARPSPLAGKKLLVNVLRLSLVRLKIFENNAPNTRHASMMKLPYFLLFFSLLGHTSFSQNSRPAIPAVHSNIGYDSDGRAFVNVRGEKVYEWRSDRPYTLQQMQGDPKGTETGVRFDFGRPDFRGTLTYGFIPYGDSRHPLPVYFNSTSEIANGIAEIDISKRLDGVYDMIGWQKSGRGTIGYRVSNQAGQILYDGKVTFKGTGPFEVAITITEGPFVNLLTPEGATLSFETNREVRASVLVAGQEFREQASTRRHEITITGLSPDSSYPYTVLCDDNRQSYTLRTAPLPGSRKAFTFSYCSDSRAGQGGGERDLHGANYYIMKRIMALNTSQKVRFCQFTGDLVSGYLTDVGEMNLQYANWKRAVEPFAHYFPIVVGMGNHESLVSAFRGSVGKLRIDHFPYSESTESVFAENFVNPHNGPESEDGSKYDPDPGSVDFPSYKETVFYYTYDNIAMVSLNSDYWYAPTKNLIPVVGGNLHGYIMDKQLRWLAKTIAGMENNKNIDHVFITVHTPFFPNGGHVHDDMWYRGNNEPRPFVAGVRVDKGIIERRDQLLDIIINQSSKVVAILTGDEHNYNKLRLSPDTNIYPDDWSGEKLALTRSIYQINNGAAGAPYYAQEETPWTPHVSGFTTQNALVFFHVDSDKINVEVRNPDTLEEVESFVLK